jgi:quinol monooxygenase YgiN
MSEQVTVIARARAKAGFEKRVREELERMVAPTRAEAGCINYDLHESTADPLDFMFHETWQSLAHLEAHRQTAHMKRLREALPPLTERPNEVTLWKKID